jgi:hypothetical protein
MVLGMAGPAAASAGSQPSAAAKVAAAGRTAAASSSAYTVAVLKGAHFAPMCGPVKKGTARCFAERRTDGVQQMGIQRAAAIVGYGPADLASADNLSANGAGQTVAIVDAYDGPNAEADLAVYRPQFGPPPQRLPVGYANTPTM